MKTRDEQYGWASAIVWIIKFLIGLFTGAAKRKKDQEIEAAKDELKKALAEGRTTDAAYWLRKLKQLTGAIALLAVLLFQGCFTPPPPPPVQQVVVIGERINKVNPGDAIKVPPLLPPAKQWYLVDDTGLYRWLDIDLNANFKKGIISTVKK